MLMYCILLCKESVFPINYNYLSVKYDLCKRDYVDVAHLLGKVKVRYMSVYEPSAIICPLLKLYDLREGNINCSILNMKSIT